VHSAVVGGLEKKGRRGEPTKIPKAFIATKIIKIKINPMIAYKTLFQDRIKDSLFPLVMIITIPPVKISQRAYKTATSKRILIKTTIIPPAVSSPPVGTPPGKPESMVMDVPFGPGIDSAIFIFLSESRNF
jgi:hypothetical protein